MFISRRLIGVIESNFLTNFKREDIAVEYLAGLYDYWLKVKGDREMPSRLEIKPQELGTMLPKIMLLDYNQVANDFIVRLIGTAVTKQLGEQTGKSIKNFIKDTETVKRLMWKIFLKNPTMSA